MAHMVVVDVACARGLICRALVFWWHWTMSLPAAWSAVAVVCRAGALAATTIRLVAHHRWHAIWASRSIAKPEIRDVCPRAISSEPAHIQMAQSRPLQRAGESCNEGVGCRTIAAGLPTAGDWLATRDGARSGSPRTAPEDTVRCIGRGVRSRDL